MQLALFVDSADASQWFSHWQGISYILCLQVLQQGVWNMCGIISILCLVWVNWVVQETKEYKGIETASGQHLYSGKLITGPSFCLRSVSSTSTEDRDNGEETAHHSFSESTSTTTDSANKVARCICITDQSLQPGVSTLLVIFPPRCMKFVLKPQPLLSFSFHFLHIFCFVFTQFGSWCAEG